MRLSDICGCVRGLHPDLRHRVKEDTFLKYKNAVDVFTAYLSQQYDLILQTPEDLDHLLLEFRTENDLTRSQHITLVAALEFFLPHAKGKLVLNREALKGRANAEPTKHTIPLTEECLRLFAAMHCSAGAWRVGAAMAIQHSTGLRPSELLALRREHCFVPRDESSSITLRLGATVSTKVKREQFVLIHPQHQRLAFMLVRKLVEVAKGDDRLFPFSYSTYNAAFKEAEKYYGLSLGTTAHSPRSVFATTAILKGESFRDTQARGRWLCESSFLTYIDVAAATHIRSQIATQALADTALWLEHNLWRYFPDLSTHVPQKNGISRATSVFRPRLPTESSQRPTTRSSGGLVHLPEKTVEDRKVERDVRPETTSKGKGRGISFHLVSSKGKGRGVLQRRR